MAIFTFLLWGVGGILLVAAWHVARNQPSPMPASEPDRYAVNSFGEGGNLNERNIAALVQSHASSRASKSTNDIVNERFA